MKNLKKIRIYLLLLGCLQINVLQTADGGVEETKEGSATGAGAVQEKYVKMYPHLAEGFVVLQANGQSELLPFEDFMQEKLAKFNQGDDEESDDGSNFAEAFSGAIHDAEDIIFKGMVYEFFDILSEILINKNNSVSYDPYSIFQYVLKYSIGVRRKDGSFTNNNTFMMQIFLEYKKILEEGFDVLRATVDADLPPLQIDLQKVLQVTIDPDFQELQIDFQPNFFFEMLQAQDIIYDGMKPEFSRVLKEAIEQGNQNIYQIEDQIFQYVLKYSIGIKQPDGSFKRNYVFMEPILRDVAEIMQRGDELDDDDYEIDLEDEHAIGLTGLYSATMLHHAAYHGNEEIVKILINAGADVNAMSDDKDVWCSLTPLHLAALRSEVEVVRILIDAGADVDLAGLEDGATPLHYAISVHDIDVVRLLINAGADLDLLDGESMTPLCCAVMQGDRDIDIVNALVDAHADMDSKCGGYDRTPLHYASDEDYCGQTRIAIMQLLISKGANMAIVDNFGLTAEQLAITSEVKAVFEQAKQARAAAGSSSSSSSSSSAV